MPKRLRIPTKEKFEEAIRLASNVEIRKWSAAYIELENLVETEEKDPDISLVKLMRKSPGSLPPIVVYPKKQPGLFEIIDGHHRFKAAQKAGLAGLWAVVILDGAYA